MQRFHELFSQMKYKEAADLAAESPKGILRTPDTVAKFQASHPVVLLPKFCFIKVAYFNLCLSS